MVDGGLTDKVTTDAVLDFSFPDPGPVRRPPAFALGWSQRPCSPLTPNPTLSAPAPGAHGGGRVLQVSRHRDVPLQGEAALPSMGL